MILLHYIICLGKVKSNKDDFLRFKFYFRFQLCKARFYFVEAQFNLAWFSLTRLMLKVKSRVELSGYFSDKWGFG